MRSRTLWVVMLAWLGVTVDAHALGLAVMDASSAGLTPAEVTTLVQHVRDAAKSALKGTDFEVAAPAELTKALSEMPGCRVATCDMQVARRQGSTAVVSVEAALVKGEYSLSLRLFETKEGALLGRASPSTKTLKELDAQVVPSVQSIIGILKTAHAAAMALIKGPKDKYLLLPPPTGAPARSNAAPTLTGGRMLIEDGEQVHLEKALRDARPEVNACYEVLLTKKNTARGRMQVTLDVEPNGNVSNVGISDDSVGTPDMEACVMARVKRMHFAPMEKPWRVVFPLVFVPTRK